MIMRAHISVSGITPERFAQKVHLLKIAVDEQIIGFGKEAVVAFGKVINVYRKRGPSRSGNRLAKSIDSRVLIAGLLTTVGVGNEQKMDEKAPYWRVVNYGGIIPGPSIGFFGGGNAPDPSKRGSGTEPWFPNVGGYPLKPKTPIRPMKFIQITINQISSRWAGYWSTKLLNLWRTIPDPLSL